MLENRNVPLHPGMRHCTSPAAAIILRAQMFAPMERPWGWVMFHSRLLLGFGWDIVCGLVTRSRSPASDWPALRERAGFY